MKKILKLLFIFLLGACFITLASKNSFLYKFNDWWDANAFMSVGKSMIYGIIPYRDLFEQKGPVLYLIYAVSSLISNTSFIGVYFFELIGMFISLIFVRMIINIFFEEDIYTYLGLILFAFSAVFLHTFAHGGSAEEFTLPLFMISLYYFTNYLNDKKDYKLDKKIIFLNGLIAGVVFWIKYTLLGFWFIFEASIFFIYFFKKDYKGAFLSAIYFLGGMFTSSIPWLIYFGLNHALDDLVRVYFLVNMTSYANKSSFFFKFITAIGLIFDNFFDNLIYFIFILIPLIIMIKIKMPDMKKHSKLIIFLSFLFTGLFAYIGGTSYFYYGYILTPFNIIGIILLIYILKKYSIKIPKYALIIVFVILVNIVIIFSDNTKYIKNERSDYAQFIFADIINQSEEKTLLNFFGLDFGVYTTTGIIPEYYYFMKNNLPYENYPENKDEQDRYVREYQPKFIVTKKTYARLDDNYEIIKKHRQRYENRHITYYLYQRKNSH